MPLHDAFSYTPEVFNCATEPEAKAIILTPEAGLTTEERWNRETEWLLDHLHFPEGIVIDYGCGIGRLAKHLNMPVIGVDISPTMRQAALQYVDRDDFTTISPVMFAVLLRSGLRVAGALAVWALQHVLDPQTVVAMLAVAVKPAGTLYTLERNERFVPSTDSNGQFGWRQDGHDVHAYLREHFAVVSIEPVPESLCHPGAQFVRWRRYA